MGTLAQRLRELAKDENKKASAMVGLDDAADSYYQGRRNAFLEAAEMVEKERES